MHLFTNIYQNKLQSIKYNFSKFTEIAFSADPENMNFSKHPDRSGIIIPYPLEKKYLILIDGRHRAYKAKNNSDFDFSIENIYNSFYLTPMCFDSYYDFIAYHLVASYTRLRLATSHEECLHLLNQLEACLQESKNSIHLGVQNPYIANE